MALSDEIKLFFKQIASVAAKDFKYLALSPLFFAFTGVCCVVLSYVFPRALFNFADKYIAPSFGTGESAPRANIYFEVFMDQHISLINFIILVAVPVLAMKSLSEEKRNGSFDLLMSAPISSIQLVLGKYLALLAVLGVFILFSLLYPLSTAFVVEIPFRFLAGGYLGLFCLAAIYSAVGLFASSLSKSLVLSAFLGVILNIALWMFSIGGNLQGGFFGSIMEYLSLARHLRHFMFGSIVISSCVFIFCVIAFFLFLVFKTVELSRWRS